MRKRRVLDLCCGDGGASQGYADAGFEVVGVDIAAHPRYPFRFHQADGLTFPLGGFDLVHVSPPCQAYSPMARLHRNAHTHPRLIAPFRARLRRSRIPYVLENVPGAPLRDAVTLCGSMFGLVLGDFYLRRHRLFESSVALPTPPPCRHEGRALGVYGHGRGGGSHKGRSADRAQAAGIMRMPWATRDGIAQAIPPAYTDWIGRALLAAGL